ncbi:carboxylesterase [Streptomyces nigrescens]|uniref:Carboxylesterase n=1 Tax=Streptomyces nigrescens TaxID=1920 RepID=A0ABM8A0V6_STRNI|nr:alpha/beta hydrolase [Streptomyces nigrescens]BDM72262.1 carboxylesterase [Streptomyces nigrescens]
MAATDPTAFPAAYAQAMARWPGTVERLDLPSEFGTTRVHACGPADGPPLVLLHGGGTTSAVWYALAPALAGTHRVHAVDQMGTPGLSVPGGRPVRRPADLMAWLDGVLDGLGLTSATLLGHSYGGWVALSYAARAPRRVDRLVLLDPTGCFAPFRPSYLARAVPLFVRPGERSTRRFLAWETGGAPPAPELVRLMGVGAVAFRGAKVVTGPRPDLSGPAAAGLPVLVLLAGRSRAHDLRRVAAGAERALPGARIETVAGATHHSLPENTDGEPARRVLSFLAAVPGAPATPPAAPPPPYGPPPHRP